jgi:exopolysaccharide biosynthesis polyprenyl glycosylphosphotransferase
MDASFRPMASITSIAERRFRSDTLDDFGVETTAIVARDLIEATDDHTRELLTRDPGSRRGRLLPRTLILADVVGLSLAFAAATLWWGGGGLFASPRELKLFVLSIPCWILVAKLHGLYHRDEERTDHSTTDDIVGVFHVVTIGAWLLLVTSRLEGFGGPDVLKIATFWALAICLVPIARAVGRHACRRARAYEQNTVIVGAGDIGQLICRKLIKHPEYGANVVGFVDRTPRVRRPDLPEHLSILGGPDRLPEIVERLGVERVVIAFSNESASELLALLRQVRPLGVQIDLVPWLFELVGPRVSVHAVEGLPLIGLPPQRASTSARVLKRVIDVLGAAIGLLVLSPLIAYLTLRIRSESRGPVLFRQTRLGAGMKEFTVLKFRTMKVDTDIGAHREYIRRSMSINAAAEANGLYKLDRSDSLTSVGQWLRKTSLDELPQLLNVLKGDMSLVGPRPCIPYETENFEPHHFERFAMPQGLTGLWQVTARANSTYREALDLDVAYVRDWSLALDLRLLLRTPLQMLRQRRATA